MYIEIPNGMKDEENECLILKNFSYGLPQKAREFYMKLVTALKGCGF